MKINKKKNGKKSKELLKNSALMPIKSKMKILILKKHLVDFQKKKKIYFAKTRPLRAYFNRES